MGAKHAGVHLRSKKKGEEILAVLEQEFSKEIGPEKEDRLAIQKLESIARKNISLIADPKERSEKEGLLSQIIHETQQKMMQGEPAVVVVRSDFVSIYWYDHIRVENLGAEASKYAALCEVPALGAGVYDDTNFSIYAVRSAGKPDKESCLGEYLFDYEDLTPVEAQRVCELIDAPFFLNGLQNVLSCEEGDIMAQTFEKETGLSIFMTEDMCKQAGMKKIHSWKSANVYSAE